MDTFAIPIGPGRATRGRSYPAAGGLSAARLVLAHGAGAGQDHPWMTGIAAGLAAHGIDVVTFDFPYVHERRRVPDRVPLLEACFRGAIDSARAYGDGGLERQLFIGGTSMGGRMATHLAASAVPGISGVVVFGYPLHPPGRPDAPRVAHLPAIRVPMLVIQGARDPFGTPKELRPALDTVPAPVTLHVVEGGDHGFRVRGVPAAETQTTVVEVVAGWLREHTR
jgi:uncharacterized protein